MIFIKKKNVGGKMKHLEGFINKKIVQKYIKENNTIVKKKYFFNLEKVQLCIMLFCIIVFLLHIYSLYSSHKKDKNMI